MEANQDRREFKFILQEDKFEQIRLDIAKYLEVDRGAENGYGVFSEYFDSADRVSYWEKVFGAANRRRIRTRVYGTPGSSRPPTRFIEIKHKLNGLTVKRRLSANDEEFEAFSEGEIPDVENELDRRTRDELELLLDGIPRRPVIRIRYHRYAYDSGPTGTIRITFDTKVSCELSSPPEDYVGETSNLPILDPGKVIMEVKTIGPVPYWFRNLVGKFRLVPRGFSKYVTALQRYDITLKSSQKSPS